MAKLTEVEVLRNHYITNMKDMMRTIPISMGLDPTSYDKAVTRAIRVGEIPTLTVGDIEDIFKKHDMTVEIHKNDILRMTRIYAHQEGDPVISEDEKRRNQQTYFVNNDVFFNWLIKAIRKK